VQKVSKFVVVKLVLVVAAQRFTGSSYLWSSTLVFELHKVSQVSEDFDAFGRQIKVVF
jgi:hypothetical protein